MTTLNHEFMTSFTDGLLQLIIEKSMVDTGTEQKVAVLQAAEMIDTFITVTALLSRDSVATATPKATREWTDSIARKLRARIAEAKRAEPLFSTIPAGMS